MLLRLPFGRHLCMPCSLGLMLELDANYYCSGVLQGGQAVSDCCPCSERIMMSCTLQEVHATCAFPVHRC